MLHPGTDGFTKSGEKACIHLGLQTEEGLSARKKGSWWSQRGWKRSRKTLKSLIVFFMVLSKFLSTHKTAEECWMASPALIWLHAIYSYCGNEKIVKIPSRLISWSWDACVSQKATCSTLKRSSASPKGVGHWHGLGQNGIIKEYIGLSHHRKSESFSRKIQTLYIIQ